MLKADNRGFEKKLSQKGENIFQNQQNSLRN